MTKSSFLLLILLNCTYLLADNNIFDINPRGGRVLNIPGLDFSKPGLKVDDNQYFRFETDLSGVGFYRFITGNEKKTDGWFMSKYTLPILPNRKYLVSVLLECDFERPAEANIGLECYDRDGKIVQSQFGGIINKTSGWQRWEWELTSDQQVNQCHLGVQIYEFPLKGILKIADISIIELPKTPVKPYLKGEGASFRGGPGNLPMRIEDLNSSNNILTVRTTGSVYTFDGLANTITAEQIIEKKRQLCTWKFSCSLDKLEILKKNNKECIIANDHITFGVQCDGLIMIVPQEELVVTCESKIAGKWNRLAAGHLLILDEYGGFTANPDIQQGSGYCARVNSGLPYLGRTMPGMIDFTNSFDDNTFISSVSPGWGINYYLSPGERLGISVFPPRPYPWKESFHSTFVISNINTQMKQYSEWAKYCNTVILWDFAKRSWGMSYGTDYITDNEEKYQNHIKVAKIAGLHPIPYMSPWFYFTRDPEIFINEVKRQRDIYGMEGVYYDGLPCDNWVAAYEEMRMTRECFPDGMIVLHNTAPAPLFDVSTEIPAIATYADITYTGECVYGTGSDWAYPKYMVSQYRKANCIGVMKQNSWIGLSLTEKDALLLKFNARQCLLPIDSEDPPDSARLVQLQKEYFPKIRELEKLWEEKGGLPDFYEKYYVPAVTKMYNPK